jgi:hypothetical protein
VVIRGEPASGAFLAFWLLAGRIVGAMLGGHGDPELRKALEALVRHAAEAEPGALADPDVPVASVLPDGSGGS